MDLKETDWLVLSEKAYPQTDNGQLPVSVNALASRHPFLEEAMGGFKVNMVSHLIRSYLHALSFPMARL